MAELNLFHYRLITLNQTGYLMQRFISKPVLFLMSNYCARHIKFFRYPKLK